MQRTDFAYQLPEELIAQQPLPERDGSRLLVLDGSTGATAHRRFTDMQPLDPTAGKGAEVGHLRSVEGQADQGTI